MEEKQRTRTIIIIVAILLLLLAILLCRGCSGFSEVLSPDADPTAGSSAEPVPDDGLVPSGLVGRWYGSSPVLGDVSLFIEKIATFLGTDENSQYVSGYVVFGGNPSVNPMAPLSGIAISTGEGEYEAQIWSTNLVPSKEPGEEVEDQAQPLLFAGTLNTVTEDGEGVWVSGEESGDWQVQHQTLEHLLTVFDMDHSGLWIDFDVAAAIHTEDQNAAAAGQWVQLGVTTNIAVSKVVVQQPDGTEVTLDRFTDIFSPGVDLVHEFGFAVQYDGVPAPGEYAFKFLDPAGDPLPGITGTDVWSGCNATAPLNVSATVGTNGIKVSWSQIPGFDPSDPDGFYQIELGLETGEEKEYGSNHIQQTSHLIPFTPFAPGSVGSPDGENVGVALSQLSDGAYNLVLYVFTPANRETGGHGFECQLTAEDEWLTVVKSGSSFTIGD